MGSALGKIGVETPKYEVVEKGADFEVRKYAPCVVAETKYQGGQFTNKNNSGFSLLAEYIGVFKAPANVKSEKVAMTAPVQTETTSKQEGEKVAMTAPVLTDSSGEEETLMAFVLPSKYTIETAPKPTNPKVSLRAIPERMMGVITFSGVANDAMKESKEAKLRQALESAGYKVTGAATVARYNPPWTLGMLRTNEVMLPVAKADSEAST